MRSDILYSSIFFVSIFSNQSGFIITHPFVKYQIYLKNLSRRPQSTSLTGSGSYQHFRFLTDYKLLIHGTGCCCVSAHSTGHGLFLLLNHLTNHLAANGTVLCAGQVAVIALL